MSIVGRFGVPAIRAGLVALCLFVASPAAEAADVAAQDWAPIVSPYGELFPALLLATQSGPAVPAVPGGAALRGDTGGLVGVRITARHDGEDVRLALRVPELAAESILQARLDQGGSTYSLFPRVAWQRERLAAIAQATTAQIEIELWRDGDPAGTYTAEHKLHAAKEAPYFLEDGAGSADLSWIFAAFVDEHDPHVAQVLAQAAGLGVLERFDGYSSRDADAVYRQLFALWYALEQRGLRYSALTRSSKVRGKVWVQDVRTIEHSLVDRAANCVDGSVLFASLLRAVGIDASLVLVPGHMFLRVAIDPGGLRFAYLETTLLNDPHARLAWNARSPWSSLEVQDPAMERALTRFAAALISGGRQYARAAPRLGRSATPEYRIVDIAAARRLGVASIAAGR
jgi:hypothetical protein